MRFHIALDSGAHSIYYRFLHVVGGHGSETIAFRANRLRDSKASDYTSTKMFRDYFDNYAAFVAEKKDLFDFCVSLDVIYNPKRSYELWCELEKQGVRTIPVLHYGESTDWLKKYMDRTDYLGIGGMGQGIASKSAYSKWARNVFKLITDNKGKLKWRAHGFAMTTIPLMRKFPWTSVDSSSAFYHSRMGNIVVPRISGGARDYLRGLGIVAMTSRRTADKRSYLNMKPLARAHVDKYLDELGFGSIAQLGDSHVGRDASNIATFYRVADAISKDRAALHPPLKLYISGKLGTGNPDLFMETVPRLSACGVADFYYMGTFFIPPSTHYLLDKNLYKGQSYANGTTPVRVEARPTLRRRG